MAQNDDDNFDKSLNSPQSTRPTEAAEPDYDTWLNAEAVKKLNGQFANRLFVQHLGDGLLRLNFGDVMDESEPAYHTAIVVTAANAISIAELIYRMGLDAQAAQAAQLARVAAQAAQDAATEAAEAARAALSEDDGRHL